MGSPYLNIPDAKPMSDQNRQDNRADIAKTFKVDDRPVMDRLRDAFGMDNSEARQGLAERMAKRARSQAGE